MLAGPMLLDAAMGTALQARGLPVEALPEAPVEAPAEQPAAE